MNDMIRKTEKTLSLQDMLHLGGHHLENLVDEKGRTYFDVFLTQPPEAVFDWPDFVDLPARYWEAGAMVEHVLGRKMKNMDKLREWLFSHFREDGLSYRPKSEISEPIPEMFDQSRLLYALVSLAMHDPQDLEVRERIVGLVEGLVARATFQDDHAYIEKIGIYFGGTLIRPIIQAGLVMNRPEWIDFAGGLSRGLLFESELFGKNGEFEGHVHGALSAIAGVLAYAILREETKLRDRAVVIFEFVRSISTEFGFVPELAQRDDDLISCETCTLMDYLDVALLLARHVDEKYWDVVEKSARNHLWESQFRDTSWLGDATGAVDEPDVIRTHLPDRMIGAFAGWSGPHCLLAYHECHNPHWVRNESVSGKYLGKIRAVQNCCAGGGIRAVYQVYSNIVTQDDDEVSVNLSLDRETAAVRVQSFIPFDGRVIFEMKQDSKLRWRMPKDCLGDVIQVSVPFTIQGDYLDFGQLSAGTRVEVTFDLPEKEEVVVIGNEGRFQYRFTVEWKGDTVFAIQPDPTNASTGYTRVTKSQTHLCFADAGVGPIYQRDAWRGANGVATDLVEHQVAMDWYGLSAVKPRADFKE